MIIKSDGIAYPPHFNEEFFTESLEHGLDEPRILIQGITFEMGSTPGENYCSQIYRVRVTYKTKKSDSICSTSLIIKSLLGGEEMDFLEYIDSFSKERTMYMKILPVMEIILNGAKLAPKCFLTQKKPTGIYVFEDLSALGYKISNRQVGLDLPHCEIAIKKIAQFHASSMILAKKADGIFDKFNEGMLAKDAIFQSKSLAAVFGGHLKKLASTVKKWPGFENIVPKLENYLKNFHENMLKCGSQRPGELAVLNHGDFWVNNMMFKYDQNEQPTDCVLVDMQMNIYTSPGIDLNYFFNTSLPFDVIVNKREHLIEVYYNSLKETLTAQNFTEVPSYEKIRKEVADREDFGFFALFAIFPTVAADRSQSKDMTLETLVDEELGQQQREFLFSGERLKKQMQYSLKRFDDLGIF